MDDLGDGNLSGTLMRDMALNLALIFIVLFLVHAAAYTDVAKKKASTEAKEAFVKMPGNLMIWIRWPDYVDVDVDLWARAPGDQPIGYSNRAGRTFNLLRDDRGMVGDSTPLNYEVMFGRDMPDGRYTVNVHLYRNGSALTSVPVDVDISINHGSSADLITKRTVVLTKVGEEITVANFTLLKGKLVGGIDYIYVPLRSSTTGAGS
jgi:hypothetical protein